MEENFFLCDFHVLLGVVSCSKVDVRGWKTPHHRTGDSSRASSKRKKEKSLENYLHDIQVDVPLFCCCYSKFVVRRLSGSSGELPHHRWDFVFLHWMQRDGGEWEVEKSNLCLIFFRREGKEEYCVCTGKRMKKRFSHSAGKVCVCHMMMSEVVPHACKYRDRRREGMKTSSWLLLHISSLLFLVVVLNN